MSWSGCFLSQSKYFDQLSHRKTKQKQMERFVGVTEKNLKTEESLNTHGDIKFWFSGSANTGRHYLLLQFHLSY